MFKIKNVSKQFGEEYALKNVTLNIEKGMNFIVGTSGSGKTTLLKIMTGIEHDFEGNVTFCDKTIESLSSKEKSNLYNSTFGFVWQDFHLINDASVLENIQLPLYLKNKDLTVRVQTILKQLKLDNIKNQKVKTLSGGQKQRVAIAKELMKNPQVIFCDEPTSALDEENSKMIFDILRELSKEKTIIVVTHDTSLINENDTVFELDKGELVQTIHSKEESSSTIKIEERSFKIKNILKLALTHLKNNLGRNILSVVSVLIATTLLLTTYSGTIEKSGQDQFQQLINTYGEGILDISLIGNFMSASGGSDDQVQGSVSQNLDGLYEKYQNDERVEFIVLSQAFENIEIEIEGKKHQIEKTGNTPVLTKLLAGNIPANNEYQVVVPFKFVENLGLNPQTALGKKIDFSATIFQWINNQPFEKPVRIQATICGVADNTVVYDYEGKQYTYTVDDSFFFNQAAIKEVRNQAGIENKTANFVMRAKSPTDLISLKDELNRSGIVPLGRFELIEDLVRLNQQTNEQSSSANTVISVLAILLVIFIFAMTSILRKEEYAIYESTGYHRSDLIKITALETALVMVCSMIMMIVLAPMINKITINMFHVNILDQLKLANVFIGCVSIVAFASSLIGVFKSSIQQMFEVGEK